MRVFERRLCERCGRDGRGTREIREREGKGGGSGTSTARRGTHPVECMVWELNGRIRMRRDAMVFLEVREVLEVF